NGVHQLFYMRIWGRTCCIPEETEVVFKNGKLLDLLLITILKEFSVNRESVSVSLNVTLNGKAGLSTKYLF
ncbi:hypothetical protein ACQP3F_34035, partial [Escherichia coli]